ncbi:MAG: hypothetical protein ACR2NR_12105 [Solirubrobacteraceae bacterium]
MSRRIVLLAVAACLVGCGSSSDVVSPIEVAQNYAYAMAEGNFPGACALLDGRTRASLISSTRWRAGCPRLFARCMPKQPKVSKRDQTQLLYATVDLRVHGDRADARLSGTSAASATREVTLVRRRARWLLTSPGQVIKTCVVRLRRHHRLRHRKHSAGA